MLFALAVGALIIVVGARSEDLTPQPVGSLALQWTIATAHGFPFVLVGGTLISYPTVRLLRRLGAHPAVAWVVSLVVGAGAGALILLLTALVNPRDGAIFIASFAALWGAWCAGIGAGLYFVLLRFPAGGAAVGLIIAAVSCSGFILG